MHEWIEQRTGHDPAHEEEQKRIAKLVWWDAVAGKIEGFPESADAFHIHPVGLVGNFASGCSNECLTEIFEYSLSQGAYRISKDSFSLILSNEGFDPHPNVPANSAASGVTVGYGYDLGQQKQEAIERDLAEYYTPQQITKLKNDVRSSWCARAREFERCVRHINIRGKRQKAGSVFYEKLCAASGECISSVNQPSPSLSGSDAKSYI